MAMGILLCLTVTSIVCLPIYFVNGVIAEVPLSSAKVKSSSTDAISTGSYHYFTLKEGKEIQNDSQGAYTYYEQNLSITQKRTICPKQNETAIYIHGEWTDEKSAIEQFNRIAMVIKANNYEIYLIGFTWDSNSAISRDGWQTAKTAAEKNGLELAQFILDFKTRCKDTNIRLIAHSMVIW
jgi:esterase/lipase superfamily enzyme